MATVKKPILTDETGQAIVEALKTIGNMVLSLKRRLSNG